MRITLGLAVAATALTSSSCGSREAQTLEDTVAAARTAVLAVRPAADVARASVRLWMEDEDLAALEAAAPDEVSGLLLQQAIRTQGALLAALGVLDPAALPHIEAAMLSPTTTSTSGLTFPSTGVVLIRVEDAGSLEVVAHELGHVADGALRDAAATSKRIALGAGALDPDRIDVDALISDYALSEGSAELTADAAVAMREGGPAALEALWTQRASVQPAGAGGPVLTGPARMTSPGGQVVTLAAGEKHFEPGSLLSALHVLAYDSSRALVLTKHRAGEDLETTLRRAYDETAGNSAELLWPDRPCRPSRLAAGVREGRVTLGPEVTACTRVGAFLVREMLVRSARVAAPRAGQIARGQGDHH